jgi:hypothetical protein
VEQGVAPLTGEQTGLTTIRIISNEFKMLIAGMVVGHPLRAGRIADMHRSDDRF